MERDELMAELLDDGEPWRDRALGYLASVLKDLRRERGVTSSIRFAFDADLLCHSHGRFYMLEAGPGSSSVRDVDREDGEYRRKSAPSNPFLLAGGLSTLTPEELLTGIMTLVARTVMES